MSRDDAHPALHTPTDHAILGEDDGLGGRHFVPEGWDDLDRGICPCGEVVRWERDDENDNVRLTEPGRWVPDRTMRVLVLTRDEALAISVLASELKAVRQQLLLQDEVASYS